MDKKKVGMITDYHVPEGAMDDLRAGRFGFSVSVEQGEKDGRVQLPHEDHERREPRGNSPCSLHTRYCQMISMAVPATTAPAPAATRAFTASCAWRNSQEMTTTNNGLDCASGDTRLTARSPGPDM